MGGREENKEVVGGREENKEVNKEGGGREG